MCNLIYFMPHILVKGAGSSRSQTHVVTRASGLKTLTRSIGRKNRASIARQVMRDPKTKEKVLGILATHVQKEMTTMCSRKTGSILRSAAPEDLKSFSWDTIVAEAQTRAPTLFQILKGTVEVKRRVTWSKSKTTSKPGEKGQPKVRSCRPTQAAVIGVCSAVLLRHKNTHMNLLQKVVSLLLNGGHASKQVRNHVCSTSVISDTNSTLMYH